jgi:hypothetical protein
VLQLLAEALASSNNNKRSIVMLSENGLSREEQEMLEKFESSFSKDQNTRENAFAEYFNNQSQDYKKIAILSLVNNLSREEQETLEKFKRSYAEGIDPKMHALVHYFNKQSQNYKEVAFLFVANNYIYIDPTLDIINNQLHYIRTDVRKAVLEILRNKMVSSDPSYIDELKQILETNDVEADAAAIHKDEEEALRNNRLRVLLGNPELAEANREYDHVNDLDDEKDNLTPVMGHLSPNQAPANPLATAATLTPPTGISLTGHVTSAGQNQTDRSEQESSLIHHIS